MNILIKLIFLLVLPVVLLLTVALFIVQSGFEIVRLFIKLARAEGAHVLKTSVEQIPFASQPEIVTVEFITDQDTFYRLRAICNKHGIWFARPIWSALDAYKWVYSVVLSNKR